MILNEQQELIVISAVDFFHNKSTAQQVFEFTGGPGTGKSVVLGEIIRRIGINIQDIAAMAYTGQASIVMRLKGLINARTIHSWLYEAIEVPLMKDGKVVRDKIHNAVITTIKYVPIDLPANIKLIVIDEGYTVPYEMRETLLSKGVKIIVAGDKDQTPPIGGRAAFLEGNNVPRLTQIMRQKEGSYIIHCAQMVLNDMSLAEGIYGNDVLVVNKRDITPEMFLNADVCLCSKNATREKLNNWYRQCLGYSGKLPQFGEKVICRANNRFVSSNDITLANGLRGTVTNYPDVSSVTKEGTFFMSFLPDMIYAPFNGLETNIDYFWMSTQDKKNFELTKFLKGERFEFGYAITTHVSQGGQWSHGIVMEERLPFGIDNNKLLYTAITRFSDMVVIVKE